MAGELIEGWIFIGLIVFACDAPWRQDIRLIAINENAIHLHSDACTFGVATSLAEAIGLDYALISVILHFEAIRAFTTYAATCVHLPIIQDGQSLFGACAMHDEVWFRNLGGLAGTGDVFGIIISGVYCDITARDSGLACLLIYSWHELQGKQGQITNLPRSLHRKLL